MDFSTIHIKRILIWLFFIRLPLMFIPMNLGDSILFYRYGQFFFNGHLPYRDYMLLDYMAEGFMRFNPPFYYYTMFIIMALSGNNFYVSTYVSKWLFNLCDFGAMYVFYLITKDYLPEQTRKVLVLIYGISPSAIMLQGVLGMEESITHFFGLLGLYYLQKKQYGKSGLWLGLGIAQKLVPIFYFLVLIPYYLKKKESIILIKLITVITIVYLVTSLPYLIFCLPDYFYAHADMIKRVSSIVILPNTWDSLLSQAFYTIPIIEIGISIKLISEILMIGTLILFFYRQPQTSKKMLDNLFLVFLFLPIITFSNHMRYPYWLSLFLIYVFLRSRVIQLDNDRIDSYFIMMTIFNLIVAGISIILHYWLWNQYSLYHDGGFQMKGFIIFLLFYLGIWLYLNFYRPIELLFTRTAILLLTLEYFSYIITFSPDLAFLPEWGKIIGFGFALGTLILGMYNYTHYKRMQTEEF
jgi:Gpi18-like mannosyltransferase